MTTSTSVSTTTTMLEFDGILSIASWNLEIFDQTKADNQELMDYYAGKMREHDIIIIQGIRDETGSAYRNLCGMMKEYKCIVSSRSGPATMKEQYGIVYKNAVLLQTHDWNRDQFVDQFLRPPYGVTFKSGDWTFQLLTIHTDPDNVRKELTQLESISLIQSYYSENIILLGDLNADCRHYPSPPLHFNSWAWIILDDADTTVSPAECAYDRIIIKPEAVNNHIGYGIMKDMNKTHGNHYLIYAEFKTDSD